MNLDHLVQKANDAYNSGNSSMAMTILEEVLKTQPKNGFAIDSLFAIYWEQQKFKEADELLGRIIKKQPTSGRLINKGVSSFVLKNFYESLGHLNKVMSYEMNDESKIYALNARSSLFKAIDQPEQALKEALKVLEIDPYSSSGFINAGAAYFDLNRNEEAIKSFEAALRIAEGDPSIGLSLAVVLIKNLEFKKGWATYQCRFPLLTINKPDLNFSAPRWDGTADITGKRLLLIEEQGAGDTILFSRYIPMLKAKGASTLILESAKPMIPLMKQFKDLDAVVEKEGYDQPYDYYVWIASLPYIFGTEVETIPTPDGYITVPQAKIDEWSERLGPKTKPRVGVAWCGNPDFQTDNKRSMKLAEFIKALPEGPEYFCLLKDIREVDKKVFKRSGIKFLGDNFNDFTDTAAVIEHMDTVISTCTSVANLAGAIGKETTVMLPFGADWRWPGNPSFSPWYSSISCLRQRKHGDWSNVLADVKDALKKL